MQHGSWLLASPFFVLFSCVFGLKLGQTCFHISGCRITSSIPQWTSSFLSYKMRRLIDETLTPFHYIVMGGVSSRSIQRSYDKNWANASSPIFWSLLTVWMRGLRCPRHCGTSVWSGALNSHSGATFLLHCLLGVNSASNCSLWWGIWQTRGQVSNITTKITIKRTSFKEAHICLIF